MDREGHTDSCWRDGAGSNGEVGAEGGSESEWCEEEEGEELHI